MGVLQFPVQDGVCSKSLRHGMRSSTGEDFVRVVVVGGNLKVGTGAEFTLHKERNKRMNGFCCRLREQPRMCITTTVGGTRYRPAWRRRFNRCGGTGHMGMNGTAMQARGFIMSAHGRTPPAQADGSRETRLMLLQATRTCIGIVGTIPLPIVMVTA